MAAATGVVLLVAGCGGEGGSSSGGSGSKGVKLDAATVTKEIDTAATKAGFTKDPSIDTVEPELRACMVNWAADDPGEAADPHKSFADAIAALVKAGWTEEKSTRKGDTEMKILAKGDWKIRSASDLGAGIKAVVFAGSSESKECAELFIAELGKS
ncbi:hypothetical protein [Streptomyces sp. NPDC058486]|uniref:hypothetical protein n=1 Tax=unclassified Streptomyces TaxID=2593676 RepID=UPI00364A1943